MTIFEAYNSTKKKLEKCGIEDYVFESKQIIKHITGGKEDCTDVLGIYPLFPDNTCRLLVFDFDNHEKDAYKSFILNYNNYAVVVEYEGVVYTIPRGGYVVLYH